MLLFPGVAATYKTYKEIEGESQHLTFHHNAKA